MPAPTARSRPPAAPAAKPPGAPGRTPAAKPGSDPKGQPPDNKSDKEAGAAASRYGDVHQRLKRLDERITQALAGCHQEYDASREHLARHHAAMSRREEDLVRELRGLQPELEAFLHGEGTGDGLTPEIQRKGRRYLEILEQLSRTRLGQRLAFGATVPAGQQPLGLPIGSPPATGAGGAAGGDDE